MIAKRKASPSKTTMERKMAPKGSKPGSTAEKERQLAEAYGAGKSTIAAARTRPKPARKGGMAEAHATAGVRKKRGVLRK